MNNQKRILIIDSVISLSGTNQRFRQRKGIDTILGTREYCPYILISEPVLLGKPQEFFQRKSFYDNRIETYFVPNLLIGSLASNRILGKIGKIMFSICNLLLQSMYLLHLTIQVLCLVLIKKIDLMHAHNPPDLAGLASLVVSKITHVPYVFEIHDRSPEFFCDEMGLTEASVVFRLMKTIEYQVVVNSKGVITVNERTADYFSQYGGPTPVTIYTGTKINRNDIIKKPLEKRRGHERIILYQGTLNMAIIGKPAFYDLELPIKAMPYIIENFEDAILVYVGEGSGRPRLEKRSKLMGLDSKIFFTGLVSRGQLFEWIRKAEVVLIPFGDNPNCHTTVPSKLYEYMALGKPIVAPRLPGLSEILDHERNGLLYTVNSIDAFSECVQRLLDDSELAKKIASNAQQDFISKFSQEKNWPKLISLYNSILD